MDTSRCFKLVQFFLVVGSHALPHQTVFSIDYPLVSHGKDTYVLPIFDNNAPERFEEIRLNRQGFLYGAPLLGNTSFFPTGVLGDAMVEKDKNLWFQDVQHINEMVSVELPKAARTLIEAGGLQNLSSYSILYQNQWERSIPEGVSPGMLTNWTMDQLFSMERLSINPYVVRRLHPSADTLPFGVEDDIAEEIAGLRLSDLHHMGALFFADHSILGKYASNPGRYGGACSAYFFIHPKSGDFLPLAIKTNVGADLVYTPKDDENDWLLAKMAFEMNDVFHAQVWHLSHAHDVAEITYLAAIRTVSRKHPLRGYLDRLMYRAYAIRPVGEDYLFDAGGFIDKSFASDNLAARALSGHLYDSGAGSFQSSQFGNNLVSRGLVNCTYGPPLKDMPYYDIVNPMVSAIHEFTAAYVDTYYPSNALLAEDDELQAWILEASEEAKVLDFPSFPLTSRSTLVSILSHVAFLTGIAHHVLNGATPGEASGILPLHPSSFNKPLPTRKGTIDDLMPFMHNETEALKQASLLVRFNRPLIEEQRGNLVNMFSGEDFLTQTTLTIDQAAKSFKRKMEKISDDIRAQEFDERGLAQGMPFIWRSLDPRRIPYYLMV